MDTIQEIWECPQCGTRLDIAALGFCAKLECPQCGHKTHVHTLLANFKLDGLLGVGGMSEVFRARDMVLGRPLAIKVLNATYKDEPERIGRFEAECALMAKVRHENVVNVYSAGWARGQFYIAMEMVQGRNLESVVARQHCLLPPQALEMTRQAALGLRAAHQAGILHRDVKPGNVLVTPDGVAKVLDFGLSQDAGAEAEQEGVIWATPFYVSPETLMREQEDVRSDIYALGMMLRNLLTGEDKFKEDVQSINGLIATKRRLPSMRVSYPNLDEGLCDLVDHMTAFEVNGRPKDYTEVLEEIEEVKARVGTGSLREAARQNRRLSHSMRSGIIAAAVVGLLSSVGVAYLKADVSYKQETVPVAEHPAWADLELWHHSVQAAEESDWGGTLDALARLSEQSQDAGMTAAAAVQTGALLLLIEEGETALEKAMTSAARLLENDARHPAPLMTVAQKEPSSAEYPTLPAFGMLVLKARRHLELGELDAAETALRQAGQKAQEAGVPALAQLVEKRMQDLPRMAAHAGRTQLRRSMRHGDFEGSRRALAGLKSARLTADEQAECSVQEEVCAAAEALYRLLKRRREDSFRSDASADDVRVLAASLGQGSDFTDQSYSLALMLKGEYEQAFDANPYKDNAKSKEPYAVLMRDWYKRLHP